MTTQISQEPGLPAYKYPQRVSSVLGYGRQHRNAEYRRRTGLAVRHDPRRTDILRISLCSLLVACLAAWVFWNANFGTI